MNREIKFRLWDVNQNKMVYLDKAIAYYASEEWGYGEESYYLKINKTGGTRNQAVTFKCEIMQYAGLKDKNGKEIYEGDIFIMNDPDLLYVVSWHDTGMMGKQCGCLGSYVGLKHWLDRIRVIGNIYENPELLKPYYREP